MSYFGAEAKVDTYRKDANLSYEEKNKKQI